MTAGIMNESREKSALLGAAGCACLTDPLRNRGTAFTREERVRLGIDGLLPPRVESLEEQVSRALFNTRALAAPLDKYRYLAALQAENETLFFRVVLDHLEELLPVVYTPTVGQACVEWSAIYERPRGIYISARHRGRIAGVLRNWPRSRAGVIVVTDGGRILGLGDLGANGMGIPIGKLALYTACAGVPPELALPVVLDVGTDNERLRSDPLYIGERERRMTGAPWDALLEEFLGATQQVFPGALVQFEDFNSASAFRLLQCYRDRLCCFNDDVQGTGAMGLAGLYAAGRITGKSLAEQRILFAGAGEACLGIGGIVLSAMQGAGLSRSEAKERCLFVDSRGLVVAGRPDLADHKRPFAQERAPLPNLLAAVESFTPTVLIGASGRAGLFSQPVLEAMARNNERPVIFALSNPTSKSECTAAQAYEWTAGRAVFASGSPFDPVSAGGRMHTPGQANNSYVFPGVGMGLLVSGAKRVTDEMFLAAAHALAGQVSAADLAQGRVFPPAARMRETAAAVAAAVAQVAHEQGHATKPRPADLREAVARAMYEPRYE
jgi:malate dehydrogenase (oxaloacetate-decarboxylating)(NADP+)